MIYSLLFNKQILVKSLKHLSAGNIFNKCILFRSFSITKHRNYAFDHLQRKGSLLRSTLFNKSQKSGGALKFRHIGNDKQRFNESELRRLLSLARPERWRLLGAVCLLVISSAVSMAVPFSLGKILDIIYSNSADAQSAREKLNDLCTVLVGIFLVGALCNFGRIYIMSTSGYRMTQALRLRVFSSVLRQEQGWFDDRPTGELVNRLAADTQLVGHALSSNLSDGLRSTVMILVGSGMMVYMSPELALVGLAVVPPVAGVAVAYGRFVRRTARSVQDNLAAATSVAEERISNIRVVKTFGRETQEMNKYNVQIDKVLRLGYKESLARAGFYGMTGLSGNVVIVSVLYYGGVMVSDQAITVGGLTSFLLYAAYIGVSVGGLSTFYSELNRSLGAAHRLWELMDREPAIPISGGAVPERAPLGSIAFRNVRFRYPTRSDAEIFTNLDLDVAAGKTLAVVGSSGSGKSTLAALLLRLYDPTGGQVLLDGRDIRGLDPGWLRRNIGTVSQEPVLFSCSIRDNIAYGADDPGSVSQERLERAAREANVYEFASALPDGFDTVVGERGVTLSGGQKQRVAIARALIKDPPILLLDEATSALDARSEHLVREALDRVMRGRTVLTIAHRLSTVRSADAIAVLQDGRIVEMGAYSDLIAADGPFKDLIRHQTFQSPVS